MAREIILDVETTGLDPRYGHRVIELACVELIDYMPTGAHFHQLIHPGRDIDPDAERVHGISLTQLEGKPRFDEARVVDAFLEFVGEASLIAHNAPFDRGFVNHELTLAGRTGIPEARWIDTLPMARKRFPGAYNSLDALCKRYKISLADREKHGALVDCRLLAQVYLELSGGKERALDLAPVGSATPQQAATGAPTTYGARPRPLGSRLTEAEQAAHEAFVLGVLKDQAVWLKAL